MARDTSERTAFGAPPPDPELQRLAPLVGTWRAKEHTQDSVLGPGVPVTSTESSHWLEGGYFLVQSYETSFGDEPTRTGINYFQYELDEDGAIKLNPDGTLSVAWWLRDENGEWKPWMRNTFTRIEG